MAINSAFSGQKSAAASPSRPIFNPQTEGRISPAFWFVTSVSGKEPMPRDYQQPHSGL
jgi:hypothetical protein